MAVVGQFNGDLSCAQGMRRFMDGSVSEAIEQLSGAVKRSLVRISAYV